MLSCTHTHELVPHTFYRTLKRPPFLFAAERIDRNSTSSTLDDFTTQETQDGEREREERSYTSPCLDPNSKEYLVLKREDKERGESMSEVRSVQEINAERNKMGNSYSPPQLCFLFAHKWFRPSVQAPRQPSYACATGAEKLVCATHLSETMSPFVKCAMARGLASCFTVKFKNHGGFRW